MKAARHSGVVLILVLVVVALLALAGLAFAELMLAERKAAHLSGQQIQARELAESGVELARNFLAQGRTLQDEQGGYYDNPAYFQAATVIDDPLPRDCGCCTLVAPRLEDQMPSGFRFGLEDESTRINLRTLAARADAQASGGNSSNNNIDPKAVLMALPGMTESIADALLDWIDKDDTQRPLGAEAEHYSSLVPPYMPRNGPPATIEELLMVRGVTPQLLLGAAAAQYGQNAALDAAGQGSDVELPIDGSMDRGWSAYLTLYSAEANVRADGTPRINLNQDDLKGLYDALEKEFDAPTAKFVVAYRQNGPAGGGTPGRPGTGASPASPQSAPTAPSGAPTSATARQPQTAQSGNAGGLDLSNPGSTKLTTVLDLIDARTKLNKTDQAILDSPFHGDRAAMNDYLPKLMDATTVSTDATIPGRININQASRVVLASIPGMTSEMVDQIIAQRTPDTVGANPSRASVAWLLTEGIVPDTAAMKRLMPFVCTGGCVYRVQSIGHFEGGGPSARVEAVLDAGKRPADILFWRELSQTARSMPPELLDAGK